MDVNKSPPLDSIPAAPLVGGAASGGTGSRAAISAGAAANVAPSALATTDMAAASPVADRLDIQPLDPGAALQILLAEVRAALDVPLDAALPREALTLQSPGQAAQVLIRLWLASPDIAGSTPLVGTTPLWAAAAASLELNFRSAIDAAVDVVTGWRDVPPGAVDAARDARSLTLSLLSDDPPSALWLRPEWLGLARPMERFWRRRRRARRGFTDPDLRPSREEDADDSAQGRAGRDEPQ